MKKLKVLFVCLIIGLMLCACGEKDGDTGVTNTPTKRVPTNTPVPTEPIYETYCDDGVMRDIPSSQFVKEMGLGLNLGNTMESYFADLSNKTSGSKIQGRNTPYSYEICWGAVVTTKQSIDGMKEAGFNTIRIPVYWGNMMPDDGKFGIDPAYFERVDQIVDFCRQDGLYVIINIHHYDEYLIKNHPKEEVLTVTKHLWEQIAEHYKDWSDYVIFEGFNESLGAHREEDKWADRSQELYDYVNEMNQVFVDAVRASGGNNAKRMLIASGYWTNIDNTSDERFKMPVDTISDRLMVSVHYVDNAKYWTNQIGNAGWKDYTISQCEELKEAFTTKGIPVFLGECTAIYPDDRFAKDADVTDTTECLRYVLETLIDYGFIPVIWDTNDNFYSRTEFKIKSESDAALIKELAARF